MQLKLDHTKFMLDENVVKDSYIHPSLVKKRPENSLKLPNVIKDDDNLVFKEHRNSKI